MSQTPGQRTLRGLLIRLHWLLSVQLGVDPRTTLRSIRGLPRYIRDWFRFRRGYHGRMEMVPCLHDWHEEGGSTKSEYFWQDLLVARMIYAAAPRKHVDIGSRVDGFVAHVASFREIEVLDIRPITSKIPGVIFRQADLMRADKSFFEYCDSLSCLHALEHFGLGRYGDLVSPNGFRLGFANMARVLKAGGVLYLSVPIGVERVEFNANHVFDPRTIIGMANDLGLALSSLRVISSTTGVRSVDGDESELAKLACQRYSLGLFVFLKRSASHL